jgi:hypothetical protein
MLFFYLFTRIISPQTLSVQCWYFNPAQAYIKNFKKELICVLI